MPSMVEVEHLHRKGEAREFLFNPFSTRMYHVYGLRRLKNFLVMSFFENGSFQYGILQLMYRTSFFTQIVIRKAKTGSPHSAGNIFSCGLQS